MVWVSALAAADVSAGSVAGRMPIQAQQVEYTRHAALPATSA
jgi:hypothetical protein